MIKMLIIFLFLIALLIFILSFIKLKVNIDIFVNNLNIGYSIIIFKKEFKGVYMLEKQENSQIDSSKMSKTEMKKKRIKRKILKFLIFSNNKISINKLGNIMQILDVKKMIIDLKIRITFYNSDTFVGSAWKHDIFIYSTSSF